MQQQSVSHVESTLGAKPTDQQELANRSVYFSRGAYRTYRSQTLSAPEIICFIKYASHILGRKVLDVGVGAGRTTRFLQPLAAVYEAVDYSPVMIAYARKVWPQVHFRQADFQDLSCFDDCAFDFVLATDNVIDALSHVHRLRALSEAARVLRPGGILAFSSHNRSYRYALTPPRLPKSKDLIRCAVDVLRYPIDLWNYARLFRLRQSTEEYALLNDPGHHYACLHYYTSRHNVEHRLSDAGFKTLDVLDHLGHFLRDNRSDSETPWLFYVAQKTSRARIRSSA